MKRRRRVSLRLAGVVAVAVLAIGLPAPVDAWPASISGSASGDDRATAVAADRAGDVVAAGTVVNKGTQGDFLITKRSGTDGRELWRAVLNGSANGDDRADAVVTDGAGDVVAAGVIRNITSGFGDFAVVKLAGATGSVIWRTLINGSASEFGEALAVAVDDAGDVVAAGRVTNIGTGIDFAVVKLSEVTGAVIWRKELDGADSNDEALAVA